MSDLGFRLSSFVGFYEGFISFFFMMMAFTTVGLFMGQGFLRSASVLYRTYRTITLRLKFIPKASYSMVFETKYLKK